MSGFRLQDPWWLLLLVPIAAQAWWMLRRRPAAVIYSDTAMFRGLPTTLAQRVRRLLPWLSVFGLTLLVVAMARPQSGKEEYRVKTEGIAIEMCIDRSGSMQSMDFELDGAPASRLAAVKKVFREFVDGKNGLPGRPNDLIGLVDFGGYAEAKCPLTLDHEALGALLDTVIVPELKTDAAGRPINPQLYMEDTSTAIGDALALSVDRLKDAKAKSKVIILLSDGKCNSGILKPEEAAEIAKTFGIKVYTIGIGNADPDLMRAFSMLGRNVMAGQDSTLDEATLRQIAKTTGGDYFNAQDADSLKRVCAEIDKLEKTVTEGRLYTQYRELYEYALLPGLALLLSQIVLAATRFRSLP